MHNVKIGVSGGDNCTKCHNIGGAAPAHVNFTAVNLSIHKDLNNDSTIELPAGAPNVTKACWACHSNGTNPETTHNESLVGGIKLYKNPWKCTDCHDTDGEQYSRYISSSGGKRPVPVVIEHTSNTSADIHAITSAGDINASCINCHQNSSIWEMLLPNESVNDPDVNTDMEIYGSGYSGGNLSASHYGKKRTDIGANDCLYCHQNASTVFPMTTANMTMSNHTIMSS